MPMNLSGKSLLTLLDFSAEEIGYLLDLAASFKTMKYAGVPHRYLEGKNIVLLFEKTSTRTRCAFEVGAMDLGMGVPVWNGLTAQFHPTQALADILTMREEFGQDLKGRKMAFFGQVGNTASSLLVICAKLGIDFVQVGPQSDAPGNRTYSPDLWRICQQLAAESGATLSVTDSVDEGVQGVDAVYTDVWVGLGQSADLWKDRIALLEPYRVTESVMARANADAIFMHCLPSFHDTNTTIGADIAKQFGVREMEVEDAVFESKRSRVFQEAENRMHTIKAVMYATLR